MNRLIKISYSLVLGAWSALLAWVVLDPALSFAGVRLDNVYAQAVLNGGLVGMFVGATLGALERYNSTSRVAPATLGCFIGAVIGVVGGTAGLLVGELLFQNIPLTGDAREIARLAGWVIFGLGVGVGPGIVAWAWLKALASSVGGCLGGIAGGIGLIAIARALEFPWASRAIGFVALAIFIGALIAAAQQVAKRATIKITQQRNPARPHEGEFFDIFKTRVTLGSGSRDDWVIPDDPTVSAHHAEIRQEKNQFVVYAMNAARPILYQGQAAQRQPLSDGDRFWIGGTEIAFKARG